MLTKKTTQLIDAQCDYCGKKETNPDEIFKTWKDLIPKIHFSSPKNNTKKEYRSHSDYIDYNEFIKFLEQVKKYNKDIDIMLEAKAKDEAVFRLIRQLKYKTNYKFIDDTSFLV